VLLGSHVLNLIGHVLIFSSFARRIIGFRSNIYSIRNKNDWVGVNIAFRFPLPPDNHMLHSFLFVRELGILQNVDCLFYISARWVREISCTYLLSFRDIVHIPTAFPRYRAHTYWVSAHLWSLSSCVQVLNPVRYFTNCMVQFGVPKFLTDTNLWRGTRYRSG
jgi:hypothetical protein